MAFDFSNMDLSKFSTPDLQAFQSGDLSKISTAGLQEYQRQKGTAQPAQPDALHKYLINPAEDLGQGALDYIVHGTTGPHGLLHGLASLLPGDGGETADLNKALGQNRPDLSLSGLANRGVSALHDAVKNVAVPTRPQDVMTKVGEFIPGVAATIAAPEAEGPALARGAITGAMGGALAPGQDPLSARNLAESAALGGALGQAGNLGRGLLSRLTGAKIGQTAEELNPEVMQGTRQPLQTPVMRVLAKKQAGFPLSGDEKFRQTLYDKVQNLDSELKDNPQSAGTEPNQQAYDDYRSQYEDATNNTNNLYNQYAQMVDQKNIPFDSTDYASALNDQLSKLKTATRGKAVLQKALKPQIDIVNDFMKSPPTSFSEAVRDEQGLNRLWRQHTGQDDKPIRDTIQQVKNSLQDSMDTAAAQSPELNDLYQNAKQARVDQGLFEKNIQGRPSEFIKQYNNPRADRELAPPRFIQNMIRPSTGNVDNTALSKHLTDNLPEETKQDIFNALMKPKENMSLAQQLNKIGNYKDSQLQQLIGNKTDLLNQMQNLKSIMPEAMSPEFVSPTGKEGAKRAMTSGTGVLALSGHPELAAGSVGLALGNRALNHLLRSEAFKNAAIRSLARRGTQNALSRYAPRFTGAITGSTGDNNNGR